MSPDELAGDVRAELQLMAETAGRAFIAQFYSGVEDIFKRLCRFHGVELPEGGAWHLELFEWLCKPAHSSLSVLFDKALARRLAAYRCSCHVVRHSYGLQFAWGETETGLEQLDNVFEHVRRSILRCLDALDGLE